MKEDHPVSGEGPGPERLRWVPGAWLTSVFVVMILGGVLCAGQWGRGPVTMDDLREVEIAREMAERNDAVIPTLAGLPFVEKPPGFPFLVSLAFRACGGPEVWVARLISASFAAVSLLGVYLLALRTRGLRAAWIASSLLGLAPLFCRVSHEILLDNMLEALVVITLLFLWESASSPTGSRKRWFTLGAGFTLGLTFLVKGFVGPALIGSGFLVYATLAHRWKEFRSTQLFWFLAAFAVPILWWLIPFWRSAPPGLLHAFFIENHLMRFTQAYEGHERPFYFYLFTLGYKLGWAALLLPWVAVDWWKVRGTPARASELYFFSFAAGPLLLLSFSKSKDAIYLLPAYPALALWAGSWIERVIAEERPAKPRLLVLLSVGSLLAALFMAGWAWKLSGLGLALSGVAIALGVGIGVLYLGWKRRQPFVVLGASLLFWGAACLLGVSGPIAAWEDARQEWPPVADRILSEAGTSDIFLWGTTDELRGSLGFLRRRTAREVQSAPELRNALASSPGSLGVLFVDSTYHRALLSEAEGRAPAILERQRIPFRGKTLVLMEAALPKAPP